MMRWMMKRCPAVNIVSVVFLSLGMAFAISTRVVADPSFSGGALHCPDGRIIPWSPDRPPPSESEQRVDCLLNPHPQGSPAPSSESTVAPLSGLEGTDLDRILEASRRTEIERAQFAEQSEHQHLLAGKFGDWAAFNAALKEHRTDIWVRILGKWTGGLVVIVGAIWLLFGRKR